MLGVLPEVVMAPVLIGCATLASIRWGPRAGGLVSAFPAVVGPLLLITTQVHGAAFSARAANGILLGLPALAAFVVAYCWISLHARWATSLALGWLSAALAAGVAWWFARRVGFPGGLVVAVLSSALAYIALPASGDASAALPLRAGAEVPTRMSLTAVLVVLLAIAARLFGALVGGMLAGLPVIASVLAVRTHRGGGSTEVVDLARGMLSGLVSFMTFCAVVAALIVPAGTAAAFAAATACALGLHGLALTISQLRGRAADSAASGLR